MCEDMCKEVGSYPECPGCPNFVPPDPTPGVMTKGWLKEANLYDFNTGKKKAA